MGGPQAGIIAGKHSSIDQIRKNPLMRTFRVEKLIYGALQATIESYRTGRALRDIPVLRMISASFEEIRRRARQFQRKLKSSMAADLKTEVISGFSVIGGGSCPGVDLPSALLTITSAKYSAHAIATRLRGRSPAIILRIENDLALLDLRTVFPEQETVLLEGIREAVR